MNKCKSRVESFHAFWIVSVVGLCLAFVGTAPAQTFTVLHKFLGGKNDGLGPVGAPVQIGNVLYEMTSGGGSSVNGGFLGDGTIFAFNTTTQNFSLVHSFVGSSTDGAGALGSLIQSGSLLYGMTSGGGTAGNGVVFSVDTTNNSESILHFFAGRPTEGYDPYGSLIQAGPLLYGLTSDQGNGATAQSGTLFALNTATNTLSTLHNFVTNTNDSDGLYPHGSLLQSGNILYGLTTLGGSRGGLSGDGDGTLFEYDTTTNTESVLYAFTGGVDGAQPQGTLVQAGQMLYGTTSSNGANNFGTLFQFDTTTDTLTVLHAFTSNNGNNGGPGDELVRYGNLLFGTDQSGSFNDGEIYSFDTSTDTFTILHSFSGTDGRVPDDLLLSGNTLYGTTAIGGTNNGGVLYSLTVTLPVPEPGAISILAVAGVAVINRRRRA
jgi:uncharacterized repeat protein (TIGR03803 family)